MFLNNSPNNVVGCVYKIPCKPCNKSYVGQTGKKLNIRIKQHNCSVRTGLYMGDRSFPKLNP